MNITNSGRQILKSSAGLINLCPLMAYNCAVKIQIHLVNTFKIELTTFSHDV